MAQKVIDLTNQKIDKLFVIERSLVDEQDFYNTYHKRKTFWRCNCDCGKKNVIKSGNYLRSKNLKHEKSCGCVASITKHLTKNNKFNNYDLDGKFGIGYMNNGKSFLFDLEDYDKIKNFCWHLDGNGYVVANSKDTTNLTMKSRRAIMLKVHGLDVRKVCVIIPKPFEQCKEDNLHREHPVPNFVLDKQIRKFQIPFKEEGWDEIIIKKFNKGMKNVVTITQMLDMMAGFDQKNPHHTETLLTHCNNTYQLFCKNYNYNGNYAIGAMMHDIGKVFTQTLDEEGIAHYYQHHCYGSYFYLENLLDDSDNEILDVCFLINYHMMPFSWDTDKAKQRWKERFGEYKYKMLLDFNECDKAR